MDGVSERTGLAANPDGTHALYDPLTGALDGPAVDLGLKPIMMLETSLAP
jgi:hypothetical protein